MVKKPQEPLRTFNIFLLKEQVKSYEDALVKTHLQVKHLHGGMDFNGQLFIQKTDRDDPDWLRFLRTGVAGHIDPFSSSALAVVLFITTKKRIFAITFGYGRYLLDPESYERRFGLKAVVNTVAPDKISTIDIKKFDDIVVKRREESSRNTELRTFGVNIRQDMLRAVTGVPTGTALDGMPGKTVLKMTGSDALVVSARVTFKDLGKLCRGALTAFEDTVYKKRGWKWIDNLMPVTDPTKVHELDVHLIDELRGKRLSNIEMTLPEDIDFTQVTGIRYPGDEEGVYPQLDTNEWYETTKDSLESMTPASLRALRVNVSGGGDGQVFGPISAYACLNFEPTATGKSGYLLANGEWFEVSNNYDSEINDYIAKLSATKANLPQALADEDEDDYVKRVAANSKYCVFHKQRFDVDGDQVEVCDMLSNDGKIMHLKVWTASSTFSHLVSQGAVAAEALVTKPAYRKAIYNHLVTNSQPSSKSFSDEKFASHNFEIVFGLIRSAKRPLPFFSRLNLMRNGERIELMGYRVGYKRIAQ